MHAEAEVESHGGIAAVASGLPEAREPIATSADIRSGGRRTFLPAVYVFAIIAFLALLAHGMDYYLTPFLQRPRHPLYRAMRPAGYLGLLYGIIGLAMMVAMHLYSLRKRVKPLRRFGGLTKWLNVHIFLGIFGPLFVVLHTSFRVQGLVAISFWSMVAVAVSGFLGRYLYNQIPRNIHGDELSLRDLEPLVADSSRVLREEYGLSDDDLAPLDVTNQIHSGSEVGVFRALMSMLWGDTMSRVRLRDWSRRSLAQLDLPKEHVSGLLAALRRRASLQRRIRFLEQVHRLFHYWHVIHKPFAAVMYIVVTVHVAVAVWTGYARF
jgi:hypothetical protein